MQLYPLVYSKYQKSKRRCAHGVCRSSAGKEDCERLDRIVAVMADVAASVLAKLKNKAKASGFSTQITGYIKIVLILLPDILLTSCGRLHCAVNQRKRTCSIAHIRWIGTAYCRKSVWSDKVSAFYHWHCKKAHVVNMPQTLYQHIGSLHHWSVQASFAEQERKHRTASKFGNYS